MFRPEEIICMNQSVIWWLDHDSVTLKGSIMLFVLFTVIQSTCLWLLDRKQLPHGCGLHLHLFEGMFGVKELTVDFVRSNKTW